MWRLLEARMRPELPVLGVMALIGALAAIPLAARYESLRAAPERLACVFGLAVLLTVSLYRWSKLGIENRESRLALLVVLPVALRSVALGQVLELVAAPLLVAAVALGGGGLGRAAAGGPAEPFPLWLLGIVAVSVLIGDQLAMLSEQLRSHRRGRRPSPLLLWGMALAVGVCAGLLFRHPRPILGALDALRPMIVSGVSIAAGLALAAALAAVNVRLFVRRPDFTD